MAESEVVDVEESKELVPVEDKANLPSPQEKQTQPEPGDFILPMVKEFISSAGTLELTTEERQGLMGAIPDDDIEIRPDGLIFPGWHWCADRMDTVFGPGAWTLTPLSTPKFVKNVIYAPFALHVRGMFVGYAIGEQRYHPNNATMTYGDACEGAKSNALLRLCKPLIPGMRRMWNQRFIAEWKARYAEPYKSGNRTLWRRKGTPPDGSDQYEFLAEMSKCKKHGGEKLYYEILRKLGYEKANKVNSPDKRREVLAFMRSGTSFNPYQKEEN